jgi:aspartyl aminopeptidase
MQSNGNKIFVGIKVGDRLRDQLDSSNASMKPFFAGNNPEYLQVMQIDDDEYIGKITASGAALEALSNMLQNVKTMLQMICPKFIVADGAIKVFALTPTPARIYH